MSEYAISYYGNLITAEEPVFDKGDKLWKANLKSNYPRLIKNDQPNERFVRVLPLRGLGKICLDEKLQLVKECSSRREDSISLIGSYLKFWQDKVENIIVAASSKQLAKTHPARVFLHPANMILSSFRQRREEVITFEELDKLRRREKVERWVSLLENLNLIKKIEHGYTYGETYVELERSAGSDNDFEILSMAYILEKSYPLLKEIFHIQQFEPLVHLDACYYRPALEAEISLCQTVVSLFNRFTVDYRYRPEIELGHILYELRKSEALMYDRPFYHANEKIFNTMLDLKSQVPIIALPQA